MFVYMSLTLAAENEKLTLVPSFVFESKVQTFDTAEGDQRSSLVNGKPKGLTKPITTGRCGFCGQRLELSVSESDIRIFRCKPCGLFGQAITPPRCFRPRPGEKRRERRLWRVAD